ncbi:MAG: PIN domain-containing protein [Anaerolineaceae bacterium]|nr:PIN domain-containing protein [Anaerolineaceae bacterium]
MKTNMKMCILSVLLTGLIIYGISSLTVISVILPTYAHVGLSLILGIIFTLLYVKCMKKFSERIKKVNFTHLLLIIIVVVISSVCGGLVAIPFSALPGLFGKFSPIIILAVFFVVSAITFSYRKDAFCDLANRITNGKLQIAEVSSEHESKVLLDTSVIIDGRIADIAHCGFVPGTLIIPNFILQELQFIADSEDAQRRQRGRRGLETLAIMQKDKDIAIKIIEFDVQNVKEADARLMHVAMELGCPILTNDYNLNKVAELQGIRILNVNDLTNAVKSILLPGEKLLVNVIQEGKEINQGVGYMEDGTMIVVENGRPYLGQEIDAVVTKILQTAAGRMIFARHEKELGVRR